MRDAMGGDALRVDALVERSAVARVVLTSTQLG